MRKPGGILIVCLIMIGIKSNAQKVIVEQGLGLSASQSTVKGFASATTDNGSTINSNYSVRLRQYGLVYQWRANLFQTKNLSLSLGTPLMLGWSVSRNYHSYDHSGGKIDTVDNVQGTQIAIEAPVVLDLNFGLHSAKEESRRKLGGYFGIGYAYGFTGIKTSVGTVFYDGFEPLVRAGIRMGKAWETRWSINVNVRGGFTEGSNRQYGLQLLKEL
jgi:hypothetical protein